MAVPSSPGWKFGYVPSPGEWNNVLAGKVDYPAPLDQGGTGGQTAYGGNYNLQQREQVNTPTLNAAALTFYAVRTDLSAVTITLPLAASCRAGDWIDVFDAGANAAANNITLSASDSDVILNNASSASFLLLRNNGARCILVCDGLTTWRAQIVSQSTGIGFAASGVRSITTSTTISAAHVGSLCKVSGVGVLITLPSTGLVNGSTVALDNIDVVNTVFLASTAGDVGTQLLPGDCCIVVADGAGGWWKAAWHVENVSPVVSYNAPWDGVVLVTPANVDIGPYPALIVTGAGQLDIVLTNGTTLPIGDLFPGMELNFDFKQIKASSTASCVAYQRTMTAVSPVPTQAPVAVAPADADLPGGPCISLGIGGAGNVAVMALDGSSAVLANMPAGVKINLRTRQVKVTGTTATNITAGY